MYEIINSLSYDVRKWLDTTTYNNVVINFKDLILFTGSIIIDCFLIND